MFKRWMYIFVTETLLILSAEKQCTGHLPRELNTGISVYSRITK